MQDSTSAQITDAVTQGPSAAQRKSLLLNAISIVQQDVRELDRLLKTSTPNAANLLVSKDIEKLLRAAEKVQMGLQSLVL